MAVNRYRGEGFLDAQTLGLLRKKVSASIVRERTIFSLTRMTPMPGAALVEHSARERPAVGPSSDTILGELRAISDCRYRSPYDATNDA
jgi:hypothetical protein